MEATRAIGKPKDGQKHGFGRQQDTLKHGFGRALAGARVSIFEKYYDPPVKGQNGGCRFSKNIMTLRLRGRMADPYGQAGCQLPAVLIG